MSHTIQERNKALVLEAFDTLFNKRDYGAAQRYWSPNYIQHSAHIAPGREGLFNLIKPCTIHSTPDGQLSGTDTTPATERDCRWDEHAADTKIRARGDRG